MRAALRRRLLESWNRRGALALAFLPLSVLYGALVALRRNLYHWGVWRIERVPVPVIVVGNVVAGGAGKTPVVMELVRHLQARGFRPGVVSRGYGRTTRGCRAVDVLSEAHDVGDEPLLIRRKTGAPVVVAETRVQAARALLADHPEVDVLVCDDGLQHHALHRDLEICVFDQRGTGNGLLLPAGPLREPWPRPVDLVLFSGTDWAGPGYRIHRQLGSHALRADGAQVALDSLGHPPNTAGGELHAVAGIAEPERFFAMLRARGLPLAQTHALPDHARFGAQERARFDGKTLLCTEKDATKLWTLFPDALAVPLELRLEPAFWDAMDQRLGSGARPKLSSPHGHTPS